MPWMSLGLLTLWIPVVALAGPDGSAGPDDGAQTTGSSLPVPEPPVATARGGGGGSPKNAKKKGKKKGKKKKQPSGAPWGRQAHVAVLVGGGFQYALARDAFEDQDNVPPGEIEGDPCEPGAVQCDNQPAEQYRAAGWGEEVTVGLFLPGVGGGKGSEVLGPSLMYTRRWMQISGYEHYRPIDEQDNSLTTGFVLDRARYELGLHHVEVGVLGGAMLRLDDPTFIRLGLEVGWAWGEIETELGSRPEDQVTSLISGPTIGLQFSYGIRINRHVQLAISPSPLTGMLLFAEKPEVFPFLDRRYIGLNAVPIQLDMMVAF